MLTMCLQADALQCSSISRLALALSFRTLRANFSCVFLLLHSTTYGLSMERAYNLQPRQVYLTIEDSCNVSCTLPLMPSPRTLPLILYSSAMAVVFNCSPGLGCPAGERERASHRLAISRIQTLPDLWLTRGGYWSSQGPSWRLPLSPVMEWHMCRAEKSPINCVKLQGYHTVQSKIKRVKKMGRERKRASFASDITTVQRGTTTRRKRTPSQGQTELPPNWHVGNCPRKTFIKNSSSLLRLWRRSMPDFRVIESFRFLQSFSSFCVDNTRA